VLLNVSRMLTLQDRNV